uniref:Nanos protein n=1 Tax=Rhynchosciara americana TaxID=7186 RepID=F2YMG1_RHYAM|nr:nanos protein [Rhynchosciara americana]
MDDYAILDNVFCTAILQILEIPGIFTDSPFIDLDEVKCDFEKNGNSDEPYYGSDTIRQSYDELHDLDSTGGNCDETYYDPDIILRNCDETHYYHNTLRQPLADLQSKFNKNLSKKAQILDDSQNNFCRFCENNQEPSKVYNSHTLRDGKGKLVCPRLRKYVCPICNATGDNAHTVRYCTKKPIFIIKGGNDTGVLKKIRPKTLFKKTIRV